MSLRIPPPHNESILTKIYNNNNSKRKKEYVIEPGVGGTLVTQEAESRRITVHKNLWVLKMMSEERPVTC
jgi:hypothetical protein